MDDAPFSLMSLEDELTCSICLSPFHCPVTTPCGHNFCQDCLLSTWKDSYSCPQCRTQFPTKPDLRKNTVLSAVVETFTLRSNKIESSLPKEEEQVEIKHVIRCDTCMEAEASQTCLTCMASYCEEHLRPHRENPIFRVHQLSEPVGDLSERLCPDHHKMMELFCSQHGRLICSLCLQQVHKGCTFMSPEEQRNLKESEFRDKEGLLDGKIEKTEMAMLQMNETRNKLQEGTIQKKEVLKAVYQQIRDMLAQEEREAQNIVDRQMEMGQMKLRELMKRLTDNTETMTQARENINSLLSESQTSAFLQVSFDLPNVVKFEPHVPRINLNTGQVAATQACAQALKEHLKEILHQPVEARLPINKPDPNPATAASGRPESGDGEKKVLLSEPASTTSLGSQPQSAQQGPPEQKSQPRSHSPGLPPFQPYFQPVPVPLFMGSQAGWNPSLFAHCPPSGFHPAPRSGFHMAPPFVARQRTPKKSESSHHAKKSESSHQPPHAKKGESSHQPPHAKKSESSHQPPHAKKSESSHQPPHAKKSESSHQPPHAHDKTPRAPSRSSTKGSTKTDKPQSNPPKKSTGHNPQPRKNK